MTLLEAVNIVLRALSEHTVASTEIRHPSVTLALDKIDEAREALLNENWWFNNITVTLNREFDGRVQYPADTLAFVPDNYLCVVRGGYLYNTQNNSYVFTEDVSGLITYDLQWADLPSAAQRVVAYNAALMAFDLEFGGNPPASLLMNMQSAFAQLQAMHTRQRRYNARQRPQWRQYECARRG